MIKKYMNYPSGIVKLGKAVKEVCEAYKAKEIDSEQFKLLVVWYAANYKDWFYNEDGSYNITVSLILGTRRLNMIDAVTKECSFKKGELNFVQK